MRSKNTVQFILRDIKELEHIVEAFVNYNKVPQIELDILKQKMKSLQDVVAMFESYNSGLPDEESMELNELESAIDNIAGTLDVPEEDLFDYEKKAMENFIPPVKTRSAAPARPVQKKVQTPIPEAPKVEHNKIEPIVEKNIVEEKIEEIPAPKEIVKEETPVVETPKPAEKVEEKKEEPSPLDEIPMVPSFLKEVIETPVEEPKEEVKKSAVITENKETLGEKLQENKKFVNEKLAGMKSQEDISSKIKIEDLSKAIPLNDRFLFIREIFNNDADLFKSCIQEMNAMQSFDEAFSFVDAKTDINWEEASAQHFLTILKRKF